MEHPGYVARRYAGLVPKSILRNGRSSCHLNEDELMPLKVLLENHDSLPAESL